MKEEKDLEEEIQNQIINHIDYRMDKIEKFDSGKYRC